MLELSNIKHVAKAVALLAVAITLLQGCAIRRVEYPVYLRDTLIKVQVQRDSVLIEKWRDRWREGDTVYVYEVVEKWRDRIRIDTVRVVEQIPIEVVKEVEVKKRKDSLVLFIIAGIFVLILGFSLRLLKKNERGY